MIQFCAAVPAAAVSAYRIGPVISTTTGRMTESMAGTFNLSASSVTITTPTIILNGATGGITAVSVNGSVPEGFNVTAPPFNAVGNGTTDDTTALQLAISSAALVHGRVNLGCGFTFLFSSTLTFSASGMSLRGCGSLDGGYAVPTYLKKAASLKGAGILISTNSVSISDLKMISVSATAGDGIVLNGNHNVLRNVGVYRMGRDGIRVGCDGSTCNVNSWLLDNIDSNENGRYGYNINDKPGIPPDASAGTGINLRAVSNTSDGLWVGNANFNTFINFLPEGNGGYGVHVTSSAVFTNFFGGDADELNSSGSVLIDTSTRNVMIVGMTFGSTLRNYGISPIATTIETAYSVFGGSNLGGLVVGGTKTAFNFEVVDPQPGTSQGDFVVDTANHLVNFGHQSQTDSGTSTRVRMYGRLGNLVMEWNTTGGAVSFWDPSGENGLFGFGTETPGTAVEIGGNFSAGTGVLKSTISVSGDLFLALGASITVSGAGTQIRVTSGTVNVVGNASDAYTMGISSWAFHSSLIENYKCVAVATLRTAAYTPPNHSGSQINRVQGCDGDVYYSTGSAVNQWKGLRSGVGP